MPKGRRAVQWGLVALTSLSFALPAGAVGDSIEQAIDEEMSSSGVPGLAWAVVIDGEVAEMGARGVLNTNGDDPVTPHTQFSVGSITKSVTALAIMQLVEAAEMDLDAPVSDYLDSFSGQPGGEVTIRQLLSHTSGYSTTQGNSADSVDITAVAGDGEVGDAALERRVDALATVVPEGGANQFWAYSNLNYQIAGRVVEVVSGESYHDYVAANILEPIGMDDSFAADGGVYPEMATGHRPWFVTKRPNAENGTDVVTAPQGGLISSAHDLGLYMATMMNGEDDVLSAAGKAQMMRPANSVATFYGLGWFLDSEDDTVWHSGSTPGFESLATMMPSQDKAVVVLVNGGSGIGFGETTQLRNAVTAAGLGLEYGGEGSRVGQQSLFVSLALLPIGYALATLWAWRRPDGVRAKRSQGAAGLFSLWFPLLTTVATAWFMVWLLPGLIGAPIGTINLFQPDFGLTLYAAAVLGVVWSVFRLGVAYTGPSRDAATPR